MTVEDIYHFLNEKAPFSTAEEWDNTGCWWAILSERWRGY